jgi:hypothetical protein
MLRSLACLLLSTLPAVGSAQTPQWGLAAQYSLPIASGAMDVADLNVDGRIDVVVLAEEGVSFSGLVLLGNPNGTFSMIAGGPSLSGGPAVALGQLDGDAFPDVFTGRAVLHGNGDGTFSPGVPLAAR